MEKSHLLEKSIHTRVFYFPLNKLHSKCCRRVSIIKVLTLFVSSGMTTTSIIIVVIIQEMLSVPEFLPKFNEMTVEFFYIELRTNTFLCFGRLLYEGLPEQFRCLPVIFESPGKIQMKSVDFSICITIFEIGHYFLHQRIQSIFQYSDFHSKQLMKVR